MTHEPPPRARVPAARVEYSSHLFRVARTDVWSWIERRRTRIIIRGVVIFFVAALFVWLMRGGEVEFFVPMLSGVVAVALAGVGIFATHLLYLTPRKLCAIKQNQLDAERRKFAAALEKEKHAMQIIMAEREMLKAKLDERPLRPIELREEIDQLIAEEVVLLDSVEDTMIAEAELWFEDVERFAKRHLSPDQYDMLYAAASPDPEEMVKLHHAVSDEAPSTEEEFAVAERLVKIAAGLRQLREELSRGAVRKPAVDFRKG